MQQKRGGKFLLDHRFDFSIRLTTLLANIDKKTKAPHMIKPTRRALSDAKKINTVEATHTTGIDIKKTKNGILRLSLNMEPQVPNIIKIMTVHVIPQKAAPKKVIMHPPYHQKAEVDLLSSLYITAIENARRREEMVSRRAR